MLLATTAPAWAVPLENATAVLVKVMVTVTGEAVDVLFICVRLPRRSGEVMALS